MKEKMVFASCHNCGKRWKEKKTWHGQSETCGSCVKERRLRDNCVRHLGRDGQDCYLCELEGKF